MNRRRLPNVVRSAFERQAQGSDAFAFERPYCAANLLQKPGNLFLVDPGYFFQKVPAATARPRHGLERSNVFGKTGTAITYSSPQKFLPDTFIASNSTPNFLNISSDTLRHIGYHVDERY